MEGADSPLWKRTLLFGNLGAPIIRKEVFALVRRNRWFWAQFSYLLVLAVGMAIFYLGHVSGGDAPEDIGLRLVRTFFIIQIWLICLIFPGLSATCVSAERSERSFDLLVVSDLRPIELMWGKLLGILGSAFFFLISTLPILAVCLFSGGVSPLGLIVDFLFLLLLATLVTSWGILVSSVFRNSLVAIVATYAFSLFLATWAAVGYSVVLAENGLDGVLEAIRHFWQDPDSQLGLQTVGAISSFVLLLCWCGANYHLSSRESLRGVPIRLLSLVGTISLVLLLVQIPRLEFANRLARGGLDGFSARLLLDLLKVCGSILCVGWFLLLMPQAGGAVETPLRAVYLGAREPRRALFLWPLLPGGIRGPLWALLLITLSAGVFILDLNALLGDGARLRGLPLAFILTWVLIHLAVWAAAHVGLSFALAAAGIRGGLNWFLTFGSAVLVILLSVGRIALRGRDGEEMGSSFSPFITAVVFEGRGNELTGLEYGVWFWVHAVAAGLLLVLGGVLARSSAVRLLRLSRPGYDELVRAGRALAPSPGVGAGLESPTADAPGPSRPEDE